MRWYGTALSLRKYAMHCLATASICGLLINCGQPRAVAPPPPAVSTVEVLEKENAAKIAEQDKQIAETRAKLEEANQGIAEARAQATQAANQAAMAASQAQSVHAAVDALSAEVHASGSSPAGRREIVLPFPLPPGVKGYSDVYFATDRVRISDGVFGNTASDDQKISYGRAVVSIPKSHKEGKEERPWSLFTIQLPEDPSKDLIIASRSGFDADPFFRQINSGIAASPNKEAFVFVHGFNVKFDDAIRRVGQLEWDLHFQGPAILFSWPSAGSTGQYVTDFEMAEWAAPHLRDFLLRLRRETGAHVVHLIAHSMGARLLSLALDRLKDQTGAQPTMFQQIVLAAPDISIPLFRQLAPALRSTSKQVTIYSSDRDKALGFSSLIRGGAPRVGAEAIAVAGVDIIDASGVKASFLDHSYFAENPVLIEDLRELLIDQFAAAKRMMTIRKIGDVWIPITH
jgi:esterase/lipase superfamily enzyme